MATSPPARARELPFRALHHLEDAVLALLLSATIVLASLQILLRGVFGTGITWADPLLRVLVLWLGLLGALAASREGSQITIDVVSRVLPERLRAATGTVTSLFTAAVSAAIAYHAARFVVSEFQVGSVAFSGIAAWQLASILPFAFGSIALRYLLHAVADLKLALAREGGST